MEDHPSVSLTADSSPQVEPIGRAGVVAPYRGKMQEDTASRVFTKGAATYNTGRK